MSQAHEYPDQLQVIEDFGLAFEAHGMPRMAGRILGRLLMCDPPHQSMDQLVETLSASKGSVSSMTRLLIDRGVIERLSLPGERHDYFRIRTGSVAEMFREHAHRSVVPALLLEQAMVVADDRSVEGLARLRDARDFLVFMQRELPALLQRWDTLRSQRSPSQKEDE